jgi:hypothetical protein
MYLGGYLGAELGGDLGGDLGVMTYEARYESHYEARYEVATPPTTTKQNVYPAVHIHVLAGKNPAMQSCNFRLIYQSFFSFQKLL